MAYHTPADNALLFGSKARRDAPAHAHLPGKRTHPRAWKQDSRPSGNNRHPLEDVVYNNGAAITQDSTCQGREARRDGPGSTIGAHWPGGSIRPEPVQRQAQARLPGRGCVCLAGRTIRGRCLRLPFVQYLLQCFQAGRRKQAEQRLILCKALSLDRESLV